MYAYTNILMFPYKASSWSIHYLEMTVKKDNGDESKNQMKKEFIDKMLLNPAIH